MKFSVLTLSAFACVALVGCGSPTEASNSSVHADHDDKHSHGHEHGHRHGNGHHHEHGDIADHDDKHSHRDEHGQSHGKSHHHEHDDALVWQRLDIQHARYAISLGHHSNLLHSGEPVEPAVSITRNGTPVSDAQVHNSLWSGDGKTLLAEEVHTTYEPPTAEEPAHYAQGDLDIPSEAKNVVIRFRVVLPGNEGEVSYDIPVRTEH